MADKPGFEWDALNNQWSPVDYTKLTEEQLKERREDSLHRESELHCQLRALLPAAEAQKLLNKGAVGLEDLLIKLALKAPEFLIGLI